MESLDRPYGDDEQDYRVVEPEVTSDAGEAETTPGYHTTGRSAAFWEECYGGPDVVPLTLASGPYLREQGMLGPRGALYIGRAEDEPAVAAFIRRFADSGVSI